MEKELLWPEQDIIPKQKPKKREEVLNKKQILDLAILISIVFNYIAKREDNIIGQISIYEINKELKARKKEAIPGSEN